MRHHVVALLVILSLWHARPCAGQDVERTMSPAIARELLASSDPKEQAWGAWMAGRLLMTDVTPQIERVIRSALATHYRDWPRLSIGMDALIEIGARPDVELLAETRRTVPVQSLLLLSRLDARANHVLLEIMADSDSYAWFAAANLLKQRKAPGFAALLLKDLELTAEIVVSVNGSLTTDLGGGSGGVGDKWGGFVEGYPPVTDYEFRSCSGVNLLLLAAGPTDVCYQKARPSLSSHFTGGPTHDDRLEYLKFEWSPVSLEAVEQVAILWKSDEANKAALAELVRTVEFRYAAAIARLKERGWLTDAEARALARPRIRESIRDLRPKE